MLKYEIEEKYSHGNVTWIKVIGENAKKETMKIEITHCENSGGKKSLPYLWYKSGHTNKIMNTYIGCHTYVDDSEGNCWGAYNPTVKISENGNKHVINFEWLLEDTKENRIKIIEECIRLFESAQGKSATELKIEHIMEVAKEEGIEVVYELPEGWMIKHCMTDPVGATTIANGKPFIRGEDGKIKVNPNYKRKLLIV